MTEYDKLHIIKIITDTVIEITEQSNSDLFLKYNDHEITTDVGYALDGIDFLETILIEKINKI